MFESFGRGLRMIWASVRMGWKEKRLLIPSILTVFTNFFFGLLIMYQGMLFFHHDGAEGQSTGLSIPKLEMPQPQNLQRSARHILHNMKPETLTQIGQLNGPSDQNGWASQITNGNTDNAWLAAGLGALWWLTTIFLEGVTIALVYSHLTEGPGSGKFSLACQAVFASMGAIIWLGLVTLVAKKLAKFLKNKPAATTGVFSLGFLASIVQVYWTIACHLILPAIVIEGSSFWQALKRADKIASGNLLTIGFGEVGVDSICGLVTAGISALGVAGFSYAAYAQMLHSPIFIGLAAAWACSVVVMVASFVYIRAAFYTCLYVWAIEAESVTHQERHEVRPPAPLAAALA
jgi:hypothetical protein